MKRPSELVGGEIKRLCIRIGEFSVRVGKKVKVTAYSIGIDVDKKCGKATRRY